MTRKVIIDCDPGIGDAVALCWALFDPRWEVVAVTAAEGNVPARQATRNAQAVIDHLDPPRFPRVGAASPAASAPAVDRRLNGEDGLGNAGFAVSQLHHRHAADKLIGDAVRNSPDEVTIVCLGPLTNLARAFQRDPALPSIIDRLVIAGGSVATGGNVTAAAEFNVYFDPLSARAVFRSPTTKTVLPLDVTERIAFTLDVLEDLPDETTRAGSLLRRLLPFAFRAQHEALGQESMHLHEAVVLAAALHPELFETTDLYGDVEVSGELTTGATVFDLRSPAPNRPNMEVAIDVDVEAVSTAVLRGWWTAGRAT